MRLAPLNWFAAISAALLPLATRAAAPSEREGEVIAVLDFVSRLEADDRQQLDAAALADRVRDAGARALPDAQVIPRQDLHALLPHLAEPGAECGGSCATQAARDAGADLSVSGELSRTPQGLKLALELRESEDGEVLNSASAIAATPGALHDAAADAMVELLKPLRAAPPAAVVSLGPVLLPDVPAPEGPLYEGGAVALDVDAHVLVALDKARSIDATGKDRPDRAAAAWDAVAQMEGNNPFRDLAAARARRWTSYAENKRAFEAQHSKDRSRLKKVLPLKWVAEPIKQELLVRYARAYGMGRAVNLVPLLRTEGLRARAGLALGCEAKNAASCVSMARIEDDGKRPQAAAGYLARACELGGGESCLEAGERYLLPATRDEARAQALLQQGCNKKKGASCARLARIYEDAENAKGRSAVAVKLRDQACSAGDGKSCRKLACAAEADGAAKALWEKGCAAGDSPSCALAGKTAQADLAAIAAKTQLPLKPAAETQNPALRKPEAPPAAIATSGVRDSRLGLVLVGVGAAAAGGIAYMALSSDGYRDEDHRFGRHALAAPRPSGGSSHALLYGMSAAAVLTTGLGAYLLLSKPAADRPQVGVAVAPMGVVLSGTLP